ncbi:MAG: HEAT repeat domain-containing protein [Planctomycetota bacterium]
MSVRRIALTATGLVLVAAGAALGDWIHFRDGSRPLEGRVVRETPQEVVLEVVSGKITLQRHRIARIEKAPWGQDPEAGPEAEPEPPPPAEVSPKTPDPATPPTAGGTGGVDGSATPAPPQTQAPPAIENEPTEVDRLAPLLDPRTPIDQREAALLRALALKKEAAPLVPQLRKLAAVSSPDDPTPRIAIQVMAELGDAEGLAALWSNLEFLPLASRRALVRATQEGAIPRKQALKLLERAVNSFRPLVRLHATQALGQLAPTHDALLSLAQEDPSPKVRSEALRALRLRSDVASRQILLDAVGAVNEDVAIGAIRSLGGRREPRAIPSLIARMRSGTRYESQAAHVALRAITGESLPRSSTAWETWWREEGRRKYEVRRPLDD